ncbi:hypothetical protein PE067_06495 [Paracoccus sp. DMF-8]|uniref:hypothetical protein n=1 Tax=Paracoccus sp. DMF-8 TaxID=3019445 RepID=UPI0023E8659C|nr:hypothetical protein [Paracoccus sp. DMF-8]MDF3605825.1 hypothetical protein [Paracoccus sp. DMF-8]
MQDRNITTIEETMNAATGITVQAFESDRINYYSRGFCRFISMMASQPRATAPGPLATTMATWRCSTMSKSCAAPTG